MEADFFLTHALNSRLLDPFPRRFIAASGLFYLMYVDEMVIVPPLQIIKAEVLLLSCFVILALSPPSCLSGRPPRRFCSVSSPPAPASLSCPLATS